MAINIKISNFSYNDKEAVHYNTFYEFIKLDEYHNLQPEDWFLIEEYATGQKRKIQQWYIPTAHDGYAIHRTGLPEIFYITEKYSIDDDDIFIIEDSSDSHSKKSVKYSTIANLNTDNLFHKYGQDEFSKCGHADQQNPLDTILIESYGDGYRKRFLYLSEISGGGGGIDPTAIHKLTPNEFTEIPTETTLDLLDWLLIEKNITGAKRKINISNIPTAHDAEAIHKLTPNEFIDIPPETTLDPLDWFLIEKNITGAKRKINISDIPTAHDAEAIHKLTPNEFIDIPPETTLDPEDWLLIEKNITGAKKKINISNIPTAHDALAVHTKGGFEELKSIAVDYYFAQPDDLFLIELAGGEEAGQKVAVKLSQASPTIDTLAIHSFDKNEMNKSLQEYKPKKDDRILLESAANEYYKRFCILGDLPLLNNDPNAIHTFPLKEISKLDDFTGILADNWFFIVEDSLTGEKQRLNFGIIPTTHDGDAIHRNTPGEIDLLAAKSTDILDDYLILEQYSDIYAEKTKRKVRIADLPTGGGGGITRAKNCKFDNDAHGCFYSQEGNTIYFRGINPTNAPGSKHAIFFHYEQNAHIIRLGISHEHLSDMLDLHNSDWDDAVDTINNIVTLGLIADVAWLDMFVLALEVEIDAMAADILILDGDVTALDGDVVALDGDVTALQQNAYQELEKNEFYGINVVGSTGIFLEQKSLDIAADSTDYLSIQTHIDHDTIEFGLSEVILNGDNYIPNLHSYGRIYKDKTDSSHNLKKIRFNCISGISSNPNYPDTIDVNDDQDPDGRSYVSLTALFFENINSGGAGTFPLSYAENFDANKWTYQYSFRNLKAGDNVEIEVEADNSLKISTTGGYDTTAIHLDAGEELYNYLEEIASHRKTIVVDDDLFLIEDSEDNYNKKIVLGSDIRDLQSFHFDTRLEINDFLEFSTFAGQWYRSMDVLAYTDFVIIETVRDNLHVKKKAYYTPPLYFAPSNLPYAPRPKTYRQGDVKYMSNIQSVDFNGNDGIRSVIYPLAFSRHFDQGHWRRIPSYHEETIAIDDFENATIPVHKAFEVPIFNLEHNEKYNVVQILSLTDPTIDPCAPLKIQAISTLKDKPKGQRVVQAILDEVGYGDALLAGLGIILLILDESPGDYEIPVSCCYGVVDVGEEDEYDPGWLHFRNISVNNPYDDDIISYSLENGIYDNDTIVIDVDPTKIVRLGEQVVDLSMGDNSILNLKEITYDDEEQNSHAVSLESIKNFPILHYGKDNEFGYVDYKNEIGPSDRILIESASNNFEKRYVNFNTTPKIPLSGKVFWEGAKNETSRVYPTDFDFWNNTSPDIEDKIAQHFFNKIDERISKRLISFIMSKNSSLFCYFWDVTTTSNTYLEICNYDLNNNITNTISIEIPLWKQYIDSCCTPDGTIYCITKINNDSISSRDLIIINEQLFPLYEIYTLPTQFTYGENPHSIIFSQIEEKIVIGTVQKDSEAPLPATHGARILIGNNISSFDIAYSSDNTNCGITLFCRVSITRMLALMIDFDLNESIILYSDDDCYTWNILSQYQYEIKIIENIGNNTFLISDGISLYLSNDGIESIEINPIYTFDNEIFSIKYIGYFTLIATGADASGIGIYYISYDNGKIWDDFSLIGLNASCLKEVVFDWDKNDIIFGFPSNININISLIYSRSFFESTYANDPEALHSNKYNEINKLPNKSILNNDDIFIIEDKEDLWRKKKVSALSITKVGENFLKGAYNPYANNPIIYSNWLDSNLHINFTTKTSINIYDMIILPNGKSMICGGKIIEGIVYPLILFSDTPNGTYIEKFLLDSPLNFISKIASTRGGFFEGISPVEGELIIITGSQHNPETYEIYKVFDFAWPHEYSTAIAISPTNDKKFIASRCNEIEPDYPPVTHIWVQGSSSFEEKYVDYTGDFINDFSFISNEIVLCIKESLSEDSTTILESSDQGENWLPINVRDDKLKRIIYIGDNVILSCSNTKIYLSNDLCMTWLDTPVLDVTLNYTISKMIYMGYNCIAASGSYNDGISSLPVYWISYNNGYSWSDPITFGFENFSNKAMSFSWIEKKLLFGLEGEISQGIEIGIRSF